MRKVRASISVVMAAAFAATIGIAGALFAAAPAQARSHAKTTHAKTTHAETKHAKTNHANTAHTKIHTKTTQAKRARAKTAEAKAAEAKTTETNTTETKANQAKTEAPGPAPVQPPSPEPSEVPAQTASPAATEAQNCPGNPQALGTSRVLAIEPGDYLRLGEMQYPQTLPLADKEVVLTFDDGPLPPSSSHALDILAAQCVKATFFLVGGMAHYFPSVVRRIYADGHTIGTHSENHPNRFDKLSIEKARQEIDQGIADVGAALGDPKKVAPFFRFPGLGRTNAVEEELAARGLVVFSADVVADDWRHIKSSEIIRRAMNRLEARGKGILLLHDIHPVTIAALPGLLQQLREQGFHVVHVVPGAAGRIETADQPAPTTTGSLPESPTEPPTPWANDRGAPHWPKVIAGVPPAQIVLPAPDTQAFDTGYRTWRHVKLADGAAAAAAARKILAVADVDTPWPDLPDTAPPATEAELPAPSMQDTGMPFDGWRVVGATLALHSSLADTGASEAATPTTPTPSQN